MSQESKKSERRFNPPPFLLLFLGILLIQLISFLNSAKVEPYSQFLKYLENGSVVSVRISEDYLFATIAESDEKKQVIKVNLVKDDQLMHQLKSHGVEISGFKETSYLQLFSWVLFFIFIIMMVRFFSGGFKIADPLGLKRSTAKVFLEKDIKTKFSDVAGVDEAKAELVETVNFLKNPQHYSRLGGHIPKGVLLVGPPGTGKTLMARAVAGEAGVPFFNINGSEFVELYVGMGAARVRDLFSQARAQSPCIIFIDELDALGRSRAMEGPRSGANDEKEQTLNQLLAELDGFDPTEGVILLAATNRPEVLDPALLRSGRFDRQVLLDLPDRIGREQILNIHTAKIVLAPNIDLSNIAALTSGFSGADLANLVNEAALVATRRDAEFVDIDDFTKAIERIVAGLERRSRVINPEEKKRIAYHEMGHACVAIAIQSRDHVHKVSIIPHGIGALGYTLQRPSEDFQLQTESDLKKRMAILLAGRVSESLFLGNTSTGSSDDLAKATNLSRAMVTEYGMSKKLGLVAIDRVRNHFLGGPTEQSGHLSESTLQKIDQDIAEFLNSAHLLAKKILSANETFVENAVKMLLKQETLDEHQLMSLWRQFGVAH